MSSLRYHLVARVIRRWNAASRNAHLTVAEQKVLDAIRQDYVSTVTIERRKGKILNIATVEDIPAKDLDDKGRAIIVRNVADFEWVTVEALGEDVKTRQFRPMPWSDRTVLVQDNRNHEI